MNNGTLREVFGIVKAERERVTEAHVALLRARADSLEASGNIHGAYEARNCALAIEREGES